MALISAGGSGVNQGAPTFAKPAKASKPIAFSTKGLQMGAPTMGVAATSIGQPGPAAPAAAGGSATSPLDGTAIANIAAYLNRTQGTIGADQAGITDYQTQLADALAQDKQNNTMANLKMMTGANANGGLYGSAYGQQLGNQNTAYGLQEQNTSSTANSNIAKLTDAITELQNSIPIYNAGQAANSVARATAAADKSAPTPASTPAPAPAATAPARVGNPTAVSNANNGKRANAQLRQRGTPMGGFR